VILNVEFTPLFGGALRLPQASRFVIVRVEVPETPKIEANAADRARGAERIEWATSMTFSAQRRQ